MTSMMPMQCYNQLSHEATQRWAGQVAGFMCSREKDDEWKKCLCSWTVVERWIEEMIMVMGSNPVEDT